jgi:hypothetical protein
MKHPILHVKKGATVYDEEEARKETRRLLQPTLAKLRAARHPRARTRSAGLSTVALLVVAVGIFVVFRQASEVPRATIEGWRVILRATPHDGLIIVGVTFIDASEPPSAVPNGPTGTPKVTPRASIRVSIPGTEERLDLAGALDRSPMTLRGELPGLAKARRVRAEVTIGSRSKTLWVAVPRASQGATE